MADRDERQRRTQERTGAVWQRYRSRAWWWAIAFVVVVLLIVLWAYTGSGPEQAPG